MKVLTKAKQVLLDVWHTWYVKYLVVCILGILIVGFLDENSVLAHFSHMQRKEELKVEIEHYEGVNKANKDRIRQLEQNTKEMEKIARERYFMKADDEDIFVLSDDEQKSEQTFSANEKAK